MNSSRGREIVARGQAGGVLQNLNVSVFRKALIRLPTMDEQREICRSIQQVYERLEVQARMVEGLMALKSTLMSLLLTGELRVRVDPASG